MSKAHKNWKQFLLTEETSDLNSEIANAFKQFEDVHPSGRPYDSGIKSEEENISEQSDPTTDFESIIKQYIQIDANITKREKKISDFLKKNLSNNSSGSDTVGVGPELIKRMILNSIRTPVHNISRKLGAIDTLINRHKSGWMGAPSSETTYTFLTQDLIDDLRKTHELINKTIPVASLSLKISSYVFASLNDEDFNSYTRVRNAIALFTGASVSTVRAPSGYDIDLADSQLSFSIIDIDFISSIYYRINEIVSWFTKKIRLYEGLPQSFYDDFVKSKEPYFEVINTSTRKDSSVYLQDFDFKKHNTLDQDLRKKVVENHYTVKKKLRSVLENMTNDFSILKQLKEQYDKIEDKADKMFGDDPDIDPRSSEVLESEKDYIFANKILKIIASRSPPIGISPNTEIYRGLALKHRLVKKIIKAVSAGEQVVFPGKDIASWTVSYPVASGFAQSSVYDALASKQPLNSNIGIILKTSASRGMYIAKYSEFPNEMEFLSGGDVFITNIEKTEKRYIFTVEFVK